MATAGAAQAQSILPHLSFGAKGGGGVATFTGRGASGLTPIPSFSGGAFMGPKVTEHFSVQENFLCSQQAKHGGRNQPPGHGLRGPLRGLSHRAQANFQVIKALRPEGDDLGGKVLNPATKDYKAGLHLTGP